MAWRKPANLREWTNIFFRHRFKALFPALLAAILAVMMSYKIPREYRADAKFERKSDPAMRTAGANDSLAKKAHLRSFLVRLGSDHSADSA